MELKEYFRKTRGNGILTTTDADGKDAAVYSRPHFLDNGDLVMIMRNRQTHDNLIGNPNAVYLFFEEGPGFTGRRLFLKKDRVSRNSEEIDAICKTFDRVEEQMKKETGYMVVIKIENVRPLVES